MSKNNQKEIIRKMTDQKQRFALRKYGVGLASVLIGLTFLWGGAAVHADSTAVTGPAVKTVKVQTAQSSAKASAQSSTSQASSSAVSSAKSDASQASSSAFSQQGDQAETAAKQLQPARRTRLTNHQLKLIRKPALILRLKLKKLTLIQTKLPAGKMSRQQFRLTSQLRLRHKLVSQL